MKVFLNDIKKHDWLVKKIESKDWGETFLKLKNPNYFYFSYNNIEKESSINIVDFGSIYQVNEYTYKRLRASHLGYMNEPFDSSNYLFYSILKSACDTEEEKGWLKNIFIEYKSIDFDENKRNLKQIIKGSLDVNTRLSFSDALYKIFSINKEPVVGLCMVYDLIDQYTNNTFGKSIYGNYLFRFVRAIKNPNGGLIPEYSDSTMRYLIIGEKATPNDPQLEIAKKLYRERNTPYSIYLETGWYFSDIDNKWRKRISDDTFNIDINKLTQVGQGVYYYIPEGYDYTQQFKPLVTDLVKQKTNVARAVIEGYNGRLGDYISFEEAYQYYPKLKDIYSVFALGVPYIDKGDYSYYFSPSIPYALVLINNDAEYDIEKIKFVAIHEIQHYIQTIEGFAQGGNESMANLIDAVGGESVKSFYISLNAFQKRFSDVATLIPLQAYVDLHTEISNMQFKSYELRYKDRMVSVQAYVNSILATFDNLISSTQSISYSANTISSFILTLYSMVEETKDVISTFVKEHIGEEYLELFNESLQQSKKALDRDLKLIQKGWTPRDLYILNFLNYQALGGELEARFSEQTTKIPQELDGYFRLNTSETIDYNRIQVINNTIFDDGNAEAGLETYQGKYIIHLPSSFSNSINLLHESGHILYDFVKDKVILDDEASEKTILANFKSIEEYFCASFVDYIQRKNIEPSLTKDLDNEREVQNYNYFDSLFDSILFSEMKIDVEGLKIRLDFVNKMLA
jgi:hypothetical protein